MYQHRFDTDTQRATGFGGSTEKLSIFRHISRRWSQIKLINNGNRYAVRIHQPEFL